MARNRLVYVGAFVICGVLLFAVGLFLIGSRRMLFDRTFGAYAEFANIGGLQNGAPVRVAGMGAGEVDEIHVPASPSGRFRVRLRLREDLHQLIRVDSVATIQNDGLVGNKYVQVDAGTDKSPMVNSGGTMQSREPFDLAAMLDRMNKTIDLVTTTIIEVKGGLEDALNSVMETAQEAQDLVVDVGKDARVIMTSAQKAAADMNLIISGLREGRGSVGKLLTDDAFYEKVKSIAAEAEKTVANLREASVQAKGAIADFRGDKGPIKGIAGDLQQTLASAKDAMADLAENTEALKRSFFFRGFFNKRGYFDLKDVSVQQYREGALETRDTKVLPNLDRHCGAVRARCRRPRTPQRGGKGAARFGHVAVPEVSQEQPAGGGRLCAAARDARRAVPAQPHAGEPRTRLPGRKVRARPELCRDDAHGGGGDRQPGRERLGRRGARDVRLDGSAVRFDAGTPAARPYSSVFWQMMGGMGLDR